MIQASWAAGAVVIIAGVAFVAGLKLGLDHGNARRDRDLREQSVTALRYMERAAESRATAEAALQASVTRTQAALQRARSAKQEPITCPPSGDIRDALLPGLAERLRDIRGASGGDGAASGVAPVQP